MIRSMRSSDHARPGRPYPAVTERVRGKLGNLTPEQEAAIEGLTRAILNKVLHPSLVGLKRDARNFGGSFLRKQPHR